MIYDLKKLYSLVASSAIETAEKLLGASFSVRAVRIPAKGCDAALYIGQNTRLPQEELSAPNMANADGIDIFSKVFVRGAWLCFEVSEGLLNGYARELAKRGASVPEIVAIPRRGTAADDEAAAYALARLISYYRTGKAWEYCAKTHDALFYSLLVASYSEEREKNRALSAAVRKVLSACDTGRIGGVNALAIAAALDAAAKPKNIDRKEEK